jgi:hypothetical protein
MLADHSIFIAIALLILQGFTIKYLMDLENIGCLCAMDWKRDYLLLYAIFAFVAIIVSGFFKQVPGPMLKVLFGVFTIVNIVLSIIYIYNLKTSNCECSENVMREVIYYVEILKGIVWAMAIVAMMYFVYTLGSVVGNIKTSVNSQLKKTLSNLPEIKTSVHSKLKKTLSALSKKMKNTNFY